MKKVNKILLIVACSLIGVIVGTTGLMYALMFRDVNAFMSIKKMKDFERGWTMTYKGDYNLTDFQEDGGVKGDHELVGFIAKNIFLGLGKNAVKVTLPDTTVVDYENGNPGEEPDSLAPGVEACTTFTATTTAGDNLFARNYDNELGNYLVLTTKPKKGRYNSVSTVNLRYLSAEKYGYDATPTTGDKLNMMAAPYAPVDGMNEKGVAISVNVLSINSNKANQNDDTVKLHTNITGVIRMVLDYAATVNEAIELMRKMNIHDSIGASYHYQIADANGDSAVIEFVNNKIVVIRHLDNAHGLKELSETKFLINTNHSLLPYNAAEDATLDRNRPIVENTNPADLSNPDSTRARYNRAYDALNAVDGVVADENAAMDILEGSSYEYNSDLTQTNTYWSIVYNLDKKTAMLVPFKEYDKEPYKYSVPA